MDMLTYSDRDTRMSKEQTKVKAMREVRLVKPLLLLCPRPEQGDECKGDRRRHLDAVLHMADTQSQNNRYFLAQVDISHEKHVSKFCDRQNCKTAKTYIETCKTDKHVWISNCPGSMLQLQHTQTEDELYNQLALCLRNDMIARGRWNFHKVGTMDDEEECQLFEMSGMNSWSVQGQWGSQTFYDDIYQAHR